MIPRLKELTRDLIPYHATVATAAPGGKIHSHCPGTYCNLNMFIISSKEAKKLIQSLQYVKKFQIICQGFN